MNKEKIGAILSNGFIECRYTTSFIVKYGRSIFMTLKNITEKVKSVWSSGSQVWQVLQHYFTLCYQTVRSFLDCLYQRFFKKTLTEKVPDMPVDTLQLWNSFSYYPSVHMFNYLTSQRGKYFGKDKKLYYGEYLFTIDWCHPESNILDTEHSEIPHEHKCGHVLALDNGNFAIQPNNRILWNISNFTTRDDIPDYKVQTTEWNVENKGWITEDTDKMFYKIEDK
jgi:hypothetical protein